MARSGRNRAGALVGIVAAGLALSTTLSACVLPFVGASTAPALEVYGDTPAFTLTDQLGRTVNSEDLRGHVLLADFIYTTCPDICPLLTQQFAAIQSQLRDQKLLGSKVELLSFTVDPTHDTVPVLKSYAEQHGADPEAWRFLTGPEHYLVPLIVQGFKLGVQPLPSASSAATAGTAGGGGTAGTAGAGGTSGVVMHSARIVLLDQQGRVRAYYDGSNLDPAQVMRDIKSLAH